MEYLRLFDISLVSSEDPNVEYEPLVPVSVDIRLMDNVETQEEDLHVLHYGDGPQEVDAVAAEDALSFETEMIQSSDGLDMFT